MHLEFLSFSLEEYLMVMCASGNPSSVKQERPMGKCFLDFICTPSDWVSVAVLRISLQETGYDGQRCGCSQRTRVPKSFLLCFWVLLSCRCRWRRLTSSDENAHKHRIWGEWPMSQEHTRLWMFQRTRARRRRRRSLCCFSSDSLNCVHTDCPVQVLVDNLSVRTQPCVF